MNVFETMEDSDLGFIVLEVKFNIIQALKSGDRTRYSEAMVLLSLLENELLSRGMCTEDYGPDFIRMATED